MLTGGNLDVKETQWSGGVPPEDWRDAPSLKEVVALLLPELWDCTLVGHGLKKDLDKLRLRHPKCAATRWTWWRGPLAPVLRSI